MQRKSFFGSRKNFMTAFALSLLAAILLTMGKKRPPGGTINQVTGVPPDLRKWGALTFGDSPYKNLENWLAVSKMETAGWTSSLYNFHNNPWGMGYAKTRPNRQERSSAVSSSTGQGTHFQFASYETLEDACADICLWMDYEKFPTQQLAIADHVAEMGKRGYFGKEDPAEYLSKVLAWQNRK